MIKFATGGTQRNIAYEDLHPRVKYRSQQRGRSSGASGGRKISRRMAGRTAFSRLLRVRGNLGGLGASPLRAYSGTAGQGEDVVKAAFSNQQKKFRGFLEELSKSNFTLNAEDPKAVTSYANTIKDIRTKFQIPSYTQKIANLLDEAGEYCNNVRSFLELQTTLRAEVGIEDDVGADKLTLQALDKVEKQLGKVLLLDDARGLTLFSKEIDEINKKLGFDETQLEKLEAEVEFAVAKGELAELAKEAREKIETYKRRDELDSINVSPEELNFRPYL